MAIISAFSADIELTAASGNSLAATAARRGGRGIQSIAMEAGGLGGVAGSGGHDTRPDAAERKLWAVVLLGLYQEVAAGGPGCAAYKEAVERLDALEYIVGSLGLGGDAAVRLLEQAVAAWQERQGGAAVEQQQQQQVARRAARQVAVEVVRRERAVALAASAAASTPAVAL